jgi:glycosyltransferase involved in cell wall biosynthesis
VQLHFRDSTYFGAPLARLAGVRGVLRTRRDLGFWMRPVDYLLSRVVGIFVSATIANCDACRTSVIADEAAPPDSVHVIANGVDLSRFAEIQPLAQERSAGGPRRIGIVANLRPVKNLSLFVRSAARVAREHPDVEFLVAGEGECRAELETLADNLGIRSKLHLVGQVCDIPAFLAKLNIAVLTSSTEGLSNSLIEYMAAGRAIVATDTGGNAELVRNGQTGLIVPTGCEASLSRALDLLLNDARTAARLGEAARGVAWQRYGWESVIAQHQRLYHAMSNRKCNGSPLPPRLIEGGDDLTIPPRNFLAMRDNSTCLCRL